MAGNEVGQSTVVWYVAPRRPGQKNIGPECENPIKEERGLKSTFLYYLENGQLDEESLQYSKAPKWLINIRTRNRQD